MARLVEEIRALSSSYEDRKAAAERQLREDKARRDAEWELETVRDLKERSFPEIIAEVRERATSGLYKYTHHLPPSVTETSRYLNLAVPMLTRLLTEEGFQVSYASTKDVGSGSIQAQVSSVLYDHTLLVSW